MQSANAKSIYYLKFEDGVPYGSAEHFFHFMWGYLLPALSEILRLPPDKIDNSLFAFRSCGPVMDEITKEVLSLYSLKYEILDKSIIRAKYGENVIGVPRWDFWLIDFTKKENLLFIIQNANGRFSLVLLKNMFLALKNRLFKSAFLESALRVKFSIMERVNKSAVLPAARAKSEKYLLLKRAHQPTYYEKDGGAEITGYGYERRGFLNIEETAKDLQKKGVPLTVYEPGKYSLREQVRAFQQCKGIIGIKGAEFANLIWMQPESKVILIRPKNMNTPSVQGTLAQLLSLQYIEILSEQEAHQVLDSNLLAKKLKP